eukprot:290507_1
MLFLSLIVPLYLISINCANGCDCEYPSMLCLPPNCCLYSPEYHLCDGAKDCPNGEDEDPSVCGSIAKGPIQCGNSYTGTAPYGIVSYSFTIPDRESYSVFKISTCNTEDSGRGSLSLCQTAKKKNAFNCVSHSDFPYDYLCDGCLKRNVIQHSISGEDPAGWITGVFSGQEYTLEYTSPLDAVYKFSVECIADFRQPFISHKCVEAQDNTETPQSSTTSPPTLEPIVCGHSYNGIVDRAWSWDPAPILYSFTIPTSYSMFKISTCNTEDRGQGWLSLCQTENANDCLTTTYDDLCIGCIYRPMVSAIIGTEATVGTEYTLRYFWGSTTWTYQFSVECGDSFTSAKCYEPYYYETSTTTDYYETPQLAASSTLPPSLTTDRDTDTIECGSSYSGTTSCGSFSYSFTIPYSYSKFKITTCNTENEGDGYLELCQTENSYDCLEPHIDDLCDGCESRYMVSATIGTEVTEGTKYTLVYRTYFSGSYKFSVECGYHYHSFMVHAATCVESNSEYSFSGSQTFQGVSSVDGCLPTAPFTVSKVNTMSVDEPVYNYNKGTYLKPNAAIHRIWIAIVLYKIFF